MATEGGTPTGALLAVRTICWLQVAGALGCVVASMAWLVTHHFDGFGVFVLAPVMVALALVAVLLVVPLVGLRAGCGPVRARLVGVQCGITLLGLFLTVEANHAYVVAWIVLSTVVPAVLAVALLSLPAVRAWARWQPASSGTSRPGPRPGRPDGPTPPGTRSAGS